MGGSKILKRRACLLMAVIMVSMYLLSGCGSSGGVQNTSGNDSDNSVQTTGESGKDDTNAGTSSKDKVKIRMVTYLGNPQRDALVNEIVSKLPNIELEIITPPAEQARQKIAAMLQSNETVDIIEFDSIQVNFVQNGFIEPLNDYVEQWDEWDTVTGFLKEQLTSYDGNVYSMPYGVYERALFYRKDWFEEKNLKVPETWDELYETAKLLTDPAQNRYGYSFRGGAGTNGFLQMTILSHMKKDILDISTPFIPKEGKSMYEYPEALEAMEFYKKLYEEASHPDSVSWGYSEMVEAFYSGITGMLIQDPEVIATCDEYMEEGTWDVAPLPVGPEGISLFPAGFSGWAITSGSEHKDEAWEVIKALSSVEGNAYFCKKNGNIPIHTEAQNDPFFSEGYYGCYIEMANNPDKYIGYVDGGETRFATKEQIALMTDCGAAADALVQGMLLGRTTAEELAKQLGAYYSWSTEADWVKDRYN